MRRTVHAITSSLLLITFICSSTNAISQKYDPGIMGAVNLLFDGMRAGDSTMLRKAFLPTCIFTSISKNDADSVTVHKSEIAGFIKSVGTPHDAKWDEQIYDITIKVDAQMAVVWTPYKFFLDEKFSHCGVNVFTLVQTKEGWKISSITDTRRKDGCR